VRVAVIQALAVVDEPATRARLAEMLSDPDVSVREVARRSTLRTIG
jgi:HEAT repeat protein